MTFSWYPRKLGRGWWRRRRHRRLSHELRLRESLVSKWDARFPGELAEAMRAGMSPRIAVLRERLGLDCFTDYGGGI